MRKLTIREAKFLKNLKQGKNQTESAILAGYSQKTAGVIASQLLKKKKIIYALNQAGLTDKVLAESIKKNLEAGIGVKATADTSLKATELALKLKGYLGNEDKPSTFNQLNVQINELRQLSDEELKAKIKELTTEIEALQAKK